MPQVSCPRCKALCAYAPSNPYRPFCSERCKHLDWGAWANEAYRVEATPPHPDDAASSEHWAPKDPD